MKVRSCGILIHCKGKYLVCKSSNFAVYGIPKGKQEPGETDKETAIRETREETSLDLLPTQLIPFISYSARGKDMVVYFTSIDEFPRNLGCTSMLDELTPEIDEYLWLTKDEAIAIVNNHMKVIYETI